ncbi:unnamed protein product [Rotaria sp. Silwood2]|nr:unnamed protein product [Rotaria sp. Silwood2]CAF4108804.1 unnamed protein product [Rotaria sp. Silwood2]
MLFQQKFHDDLFLIDLALLLKLVSRVPNATAELKRIVEDYFLKIGIDTIERVSSSAISACHKFINNNAVTKAAGKTAKSPELLARYCDGLLRKGFAKFERLLLKYNQF